MNNQYVKDVADYLAINYKAARGKICRIQRYINPLPSFKTIAKVIKRNKKSVTEQKIALQITKNNSNYTFLKREFHKKQRMKEPNSPIYFEVKGLLYPNLSVSDFNKINIARLKDKTPKGIAIFITHAFSGYILKKDLDLYKVIKDSTYPELRTEHFVIIRKQYPEINERKCIIEQIINDFDEYIKIKDIPLYNRVKSSLLPDLTVKVFSSTIKITDDKKTETIVDYIVRNHKEYLPKTFIKKINNLIYPKPSSLLIKRIMNDFPSLRNPIKFAELFVETYPQYIAIRDKPLYSRVDNHFISKLPVKVFSRIKKLHPDCYSDIEIINQIDKNHPDYILTIYKETIEKIHPTPPVEIVRNFRIKNIHITKTQTLAEKFAEKHLEYITKKEKTLFDEVDKLVYPDLSIRVYCKIQKKYPNITSPKKIALQISKIYNQYLLLSNALLIKEYIYPNISIKKISDAKKEANVHFSPLELSKYITSQDENFILKTTIPYFKQVKNYIYPNLSVDTFCIGINQSGIDNQAKQLATYISKTNNDYIMISKCDQIRELIYPTIKNKDILSVSKFLPPDASISTIASNICKKNPHYLHMNEKSLYEEVKQDYLPTLKITEFSSLNEIFHGIEWMKEKVYLQKKYKFFKSVQDFLYPKPLFKDIHEQMKNNPPIKQPRMIAKKLAESNEDYTFLSDVLSSKGWYG
jgi:hypothetical protein